MSQDESVWEFPCEFPIKVMGRADSDFVETVIKLVSKHAPEVDKSRVALRESKQGNYVSVTVTVTATSKQQLDNIYLELNGHEAVLMTL